MSLEVLSLRTSGDIIIIITKDNVILKIKLLLLCLDLNDRKVNAINMMILRPCFVRKKQKMSWSRIKVNRGFGQL